LNLALDCRVKPGNDGSFPITAVLVTAIHDFGAREGMSWMCAVNVQYR
jgi:hypothetical protein